MRNTVLAIIMLCCTVFAGTSYKFLNHSSDASLSGTAESDIIDFSSSSLLNNPSSLAFSPNMLDISASYNGETLYQNLLSLTAGLKLGPGRIGYKGMFFFIPNSRFSLVTGTEKGLYNGIYSGFTYSLLLRDLSEKINIPLAFGAGASFVTEMVAGQMTAGLVFDFGTTLALLDDTLFFAISANHMGTGFKSTTVPWSFNFGSKYILNKIKNLDFIFSLRYRMDELDYNSFAFGLSSLIIDKIIISLGYKFDAFEELGSYNNAFHFGLGARFLNYEIDAAVIPAPELNTRVLGTFKFFYTKKYKKMSTEDIKESTVEDIIREAEKAIADGDLEYARTLIKEGIAKDPANDRLFELLRQLKK